MFIDRTIYTYTASKQLPSLLQGLFVSEFIAPSKSFYLYSPWISNIPVMDNSTNSFRHINPRWPRGIITIRQALEQLLDLGTEVYLFSNTKEHNDATFLWIEQMRARGYNNIYGARNADLHQKGLLGDRFFLSGSMNFTVNGLTALHERIEFTTDKEKVARAHHEFVIYWQDNQAKVDKGI